MPDPAIPTDVLSTTLKHLNSKKTNYYRSLEMDPDNSDHFNAEIDRLNIAISWFEAQRETLRSA